MPVNLTVNGKKRSVDGDPTKPLLWVLREDLDLVGTKFGCVEQDNCYGMPPLESIKISFENLRKLGAA